MDEIIKLLQNEIYRLDWKIGVAADDIRNENTTNTDWYDISVSRRTKLLECLNKLKELQ